MQVGFQREAAAPEEALLAPAQAPAVFDQPVVLAIISSAIAHDDHCVVQRICAASGDVCMQEITRQEVTIGLQTLMIIRGCMRPLKAILAVQLPSWKVMSSDDVVMMLSAAARSLQGGRTVDNR